MFSASTWFWICAALIFYTYVAYPVLVWGLSQAYTWAVNPPSVDPENWPSVSLLIAAHNEERVIGRRIQNALAMDYPVPLLEIVIALDGCTDATSTIVRRYASKGVKLLDYSQRRGKASVLNSVIKGLRGEIVLLSDANTDFDDQAVQRLARWFSHPRVGVVCGRLVLTDSLKGGNVDSVYWKYETFLKRCEGRLGALLGANGAIYAIRKELYEPIRPESTNDDLEIPLMAKLKTDCAIVYDFDALAYEESAPNMQSEFRRRVRIGASGFQSLVTLWKLVDPRRGWIAFTFFSHKLLRWSCPFFLICMLLSNLLLLDRLFYQFVLMFQISFYLTSLAVVFFPSQVRFPKPVRFVAMFTSMNFALLVGFFRWLSGRHKGTWDPTIRMADAEAREIC
jgi:cellulose synthase/poly-beta-1,6-N-acetylglucosamine synthase-like glycosyltransferase